MIPKKLFLFFILGFMVFSKAEELSVDDLLQMSIEELTQLEIYSGSKHKESIKEIPASVYILMREDIKRYGYRTLSDAIQSIPGMYNIYSYNGAPGNFGLRGFWNPNQQNSSFHILINGVRQYSFDRRSSLMEQISIPIEAIDRIEVIRGPNAVIYGNGASFGVINIVANEVTDTKKDSLIAYSYGSLNTHRAAVRVAIKENDLKVVINSGAYKTDGLNNKFTDMMTADNAATLPGAGVTDPNYSTKELLEQKNRYFNVSGSYKHWYFDMAYNQSDSEYFILVPSVEDGSIAKTDSSTFTLGYRTDLTSWLDIDLKGSYYRLNRKIEYDGFSPSFYGLSDSNYNAYDIELLSNIKPYEDLNILLGLNYQGMSDLDEYTDIPALGFDNDRFLIDDRPTRAIFTQLNYKTTDNLRLIAGIRFEELKSYNRLFIADAGSGSANKIESDRGNIHISSPRLAAVYNYDKNNIFKLMYGESSRISDDNFDPEETQTIEGNYLYMSDGFYSSFSLFHNSLKNLLVPILEDDGMGGANRTEDTSGDISTYGAELIIHSNLNENWTGEIGITYQDTQNQNNKSLEVAYSPDTLVHFKTAYTYQKATVALMARYVDSMQSFYDPGIDNGDGSYGARVGEEVDDYTVVDLNARVDNVYEGFYLNVKATNIFDSEIRYPNNNDNNTLLNKGTIGEGFGLMGTIGREF